MDKRLLPVFLSPCFTACPAHHNWLFVGINSLSNLKRIKNLNSASEPDLGVDSAAPVAGVPFSDQVILDSEAYRTTGYLPFSPFEGFAAGAAL